MHALKTGALIRASALSGAIMGGADERRVAAIDRYAREVDVRALGGSARRRRQEDMRPQERVAALMRGRERASGSAGFDPPIAKFQPELR